MGFGGLKNNINGMGIGGGGVGGGSVKRENFYSTKMQAEHLLKRKKPEKKPIEEIDIECLDSELEDQNQAGDPNGEANPGGDKNSSVRNFC